MAKFRLYEDGLIVHQDEWDAIADPQRETIAYEETEVSEYCLISQACAMGFDIEQTMEWLAEYGFYPETGTVEGIFSLLERVFFLDLELAAYKA
jgi:hypothetical protein